MSFCVLRIVAFVSINEKFPASAITLATTEKTFLDVYTAFMNRFAMVMMPKLNQQAYESQAFICRSDTFFGFAFFFVFLLTCFALLRFPSSVSFLAVIILDAVVTESFYQLSHRSVYLHESECLRVQYKQNRNAIQKKYQRYEFAKDTQSDTR